MTVKDIVKREFYLNLLDEKANVALLGARKTGKTILLKESLKENSVYINLDKLSINPENFTIEFMGNICFHYLKKPISEYKNFLRLETLISLTNLNKNAYSIIKTVENELLKIKPDQKLLVKSAFDFAEAIAKEKRLIIALDNFENLLDLNNFSQIKDVLSIINFKSANIKYVITSSAVNSLKKILKDFKIVELKNFDKKETSLLIEKIVKADKKTIDEIFNLSRGHPFIAERIALRYKEVKDVKKAFLIELLTKNFGIYNYCKEAIDYSLNRARGKTLLFAILKVLSFDKELKLSEIARRIYRSAPITKSLLERLIEVDLISKKDSKFSFTDDVLSLFVKLTSSGFEFDYVPEDNMLDKIEL